MTENVLYQIPVQAAEMGLLRRVNGVTLRDKVLSCEIRNALNVELLLRLLRLWEISATLVRPRDHNAPVNICEVIRTGYTHGKRLRVDQGPGGDKTLMQISIGLLDRAHKNAATERTNFKR